MQQQLLQGEPGVAGAVALGGGIRGQRQRQGRGGAGRVVAAERRLTATAEPKAQLRDCRNRSTSALPTKNTLPPPRIAGIRNSPMSRMKTSIDPVSTPGIDRGRVI